MFASVAAKIRLKPLPSLQKIMVPYMVDHMVNQSLSDK